MLHTVNTGISAFWRPFSLKKHNRISLIDEDVCFAKMSHPYILCVCFCVIYVYSNKSSLFCIIFALFKKSDGHTQGNFVLYLL